jgi:hypothetical protein
MQALISASAESDKGQRAIAQATYGIIFLGTPLRGTDLQPYLSFLRGLASISGATTNKALPEALKRGSEELLSTQDTFHKLLDVPRHERGLQNMKIMCFFEELDTKLIGRKVDGPRL